MDVSEQVYERRTGRKLGAIASIAGIFGAGLLGVLRYRGIAGIPYPMVTAAFAAASIAGPVADRIGRRWARRRLRLALEGETARRELQSRAMAAGAETSSISWTLANNAVLGLVSSLWLFGIAKGALLVTVGKALSYLMAHGGFTIAAFAFAAWMQGRALSRKKPKKKKMVLPALLVLASIVLAPLLGDPGIPFALMIALASVYVGGASLLVVAPTMVFSRRRMLRERYALGQRTLPSPTEDAELAKKMLRATLDWEEGPEPLRADALRALAARLPSEEIGVELDRSITIGTRELRRAGLELSRDLRHRPPLELLIELVRNASAEEAALLPPLLHRYRAQAVESALLALLARESGDVAAAAAESLGLIGSASVVERLKGAAQRGGRVAASCAEAIERIRIRLSQAPGQLSVIDDPDTGALSETSSASLSFPRS